MSDISENDFWYTLNEPEPEIENIINGGKVYRWYNDQGELHREIDLPAEVGFFNNNIIYIQGWWKNGKLHRDNNPAVIRYNKEGNKVYEIFAKDGNITTTIYY